MEVYYCLCRWTITNKLLKLVILISFRKAFLNFCCQFQKYAVEENKASREERNRICDGWEVFTFVFFTVYCWRRRISLSGTFLQSYIYVEKKCNDQVIVAIHIVFLKDMSVLKISEPKKLVWQHFYFFFFFFFFFVNITRSMLFKSRYCPNFKAEAMQEKLFWKFNNKC